MIMRRSVWVSASLLAAAACAPRTTATKPYDVLVSGGTVVDGTGQPRFRADVAVQGDRVVRVSREPIPADSAALVLDAEGHHTRFGAEIREETVTRVDFSGPPHKAFVGDAATTGIVSLPGVGAGAPTPVSTPFTGPGGGALRRTQTSMSINARHSF